MKWPSYCFFFLVFGCGREATLADCDAIIKKGIEVSLDPALDPVERSKKLEAYAKDFLADRQTCVGKTVTDSYMNCVYNAKLSSDLEACAK